jgi:cyclic-di-GMP phosphodiesterase TipF (flagellum assembly factor)
MIAADGRAPPMTRYAAISAAFGMMLIAAALGATGYFVLDLMPEQAAIIALAALAIMALYQSVATRLRDRTDIGDQIADLSRTSSDIARKLAEIDRRVAAMETTVEGSLGNTRAVVDPLTTAIGEFDARLCQVADALTANETAVAALRAAGPAPVAPAPPVVAEPTPPPEALPAGMGGATPHPLFRLHDLSREDGLAIIRAALDADRLDLYLQPIVSLPQRKVRFYEALARLRTVTGEHLPTAGVVDLAESAGLLPEIDDQTLFRAVEVVRRFRLQERSIGLFCNLSAAAIRDPACFARVHEFIAANRKLAPALILEFPQSVVRSFGDAENERLTTLMALGFGFSMDNAEDLRISPPELARHGFKFVKVAARLLVRNSRAAMSGIKPADLSDQLGRHGIDLIADRIESEEAVVHLIDHDVRLGQGFLFSPPRPLKAEGPAMVAPVIPEPRDSRPATDSPAATVQH